MKAYGKRTLSALLLSLLSLILFFPAQAKTILVMGDSISAAYGMETEHGWVALLEQRLEQKFPNEHTVVNGSMSGETAAGALSRLPHLLATHEPDVVLIELGGNDGLRGQPPRLIEQNLDRLVQMSLEAGAQPLLLGMRIPPNYGSAYSQAFIDNYPRVAERYEVPLVPFFLEGVAGDDALMQADGIHPRREAQAMLLENVWPALKPLLTSED